MTFKNHFVSILLTVNSRYPIGEWDRLITQAIITLNLLHSSRIHPSLSAHASSFGNYDYNYTPIAPPGTQVVVHSSVDSLTTFGPHGRIGWYIGPSLEHYRCYKVYFPDPLHKCDVLKFDFFHQKVPFPKITNEEYLRQTAEDMLQLLHATKPSHNPNPLTFSAPVLNAFGEVARILGRSVTKRGHHRS